MAKEMVELQNRTSIAGSKHVHTATLGVLIPLDNEIPIDSGSFCKRTWTQASSVNFALTMNEARLSNVHTFIEGLTPRATMILHTRRAGLVHCTLG
jgi:hypothetical protein